MNSHFFIGHTDAADTDLAGRLEAWLGRRYTSKRPWPKRQPGLVLDAQGLRLFTPNHKPQYWHPGMAHLRQKRTNDPLVTALALPRNSKVIDCTFGMGHDSLVLAHFGHRVAAFEISAPLLTFSAFGLNAYRPELGKFISVSCCDYRKRLRKESSNSVDAVYLDPMFAASKKRLDGFTWSVMRDLGLQKSRWSPNDIREAYRVASRTVLLKLSPFEHPPLIDGLPKPSLEGSHRVKFAKWQKVLSE